MPAGRRLPDGLRQALFAELKGGTLDVRQLDAVRWLEQTSLPVGQVTADVETRVLASAGMKLDGTALSASKQGQRRRYLSKLLGYAVAKDLLPANPVSRVKRQTARKASTAVSKREISSPELARTIIGAVADSMHRDFVKTVYLAGARPSEVAALRVTDCRLPDTSWGVLFLRKSAAEAGDPDQATHVPTRRNLRLRRIRLAAFNIQPDRTGPRLIAVLPLNWHVPILHRRANSPLDSGRFSPVGALANVNCIDKGSRGRDACLILATKERATCGTLWPRRHLRIESTCSWNWPDEPSTSAPTRERGI